MQVAYVCPLRASPYDAEPFLLGGHFNPAVTFALLCFRKISIIKAICYVISQILGATVGVAFVDALYWKEAGLCFILSPRRLFLMCNDNRSNSTAHLLAAGEATKYGTNAPAQGIRIDLGLAGHCS
jgi:hypothetical protein